MEPMQVMTDRPTISDIALGVFLGLWTFAISIGVIAAIAVVAIAQMRHST